MSRFIPLIPEGWSLKQVADVYTVNDEVLGSKTPASFNFKYVELDLVDTQNVNYCGAQAYKFDEAPGRARRLLATGDFLFSTVRPNLLGFAKFAPPNNDTWVGSTGLAVARPKEGVDGDFFFYQLLSAIGQRQFHALVTGSNYPAINDSQFKRIEVLSPPREQQKRIASILATVDSAIAATQASIVAAQKLKRALMQNLLTGKLKPDGTWRRDDEFDIDPKFGRVPKGWSVVSVKDATVNLDSKRKPVKAEERATMLGQYPYYGASGIVDHVNDYLFDGEYILFGEDGENLLSRNVPLAFIVRGKFWVNNHAHVLQVREGYDIKFICDLLESRDYRRVVIGSAQPKINQAQLARVRLCVPDYTEQVEITDAIDRTKRVIQDKEKKLLALQKLKKSLMQNLLTGKVRIPPNLVIE